ncbi:TPA: phage tail fiber protein [Salmonella enterica subsp. enterica serovar Reading]
MSIPVQTPFNLYVANGSTTVFPYGFLLNQSSDLRVTANGVVVSSGFSVSGEGNQSGGQITFSTPPASGTKIAILRNIPLRRDTEYQDNGDLLASTINADFDRLWMAVQGIDSETNLALSRSGQDVSYYDAKGMPVKNLKDPVDQQDAVTKSVLDNAVTRMGQQVQDAKTHLDVVWQSVSQNAVAAKQSEVNSGTSEQQAAQHAKDALDTLTKTQAAAENAATTAATETTALLKNEFNSEVNRAETAATNAATSATEAQKAALDAKQAASSAAADAVASAVPEAVSQVKAAVADDANRAETAATNAAASEQQAAQALKEAQEIAKTPGKSAYEIWVSQQPAGSDTSMDAYMEYQKGKSGSDGDVKKTDIPAYLVRKTLAYGDDLNDLVGDGKEGIYPFNADYLVNSPDISMSNGGSVQVRKLNDNNFVQELVTTQGEIWSRISSGTDFTDWAAVIRHRPDNPEDNSWDYPGSYGLFLITADVDLTASTGSSDDPGMTITYPQLVEGRHLAPVGFRIDKSTRTPEIVLMNHTMSGIWEIHGFFVIDHSGDSVVLALRTK